MGGVTNSVCRLPFAVWLCLYTRPVGTMISSMPSGPVMTWPFTPKTSRSVSGVRTVSGVPSA